MLKGCPPASPPVVSPFPSTILPSPPWQPPLFHAICFVGHWPSMPLSPSAAERQSRGHTQGESAQPPASPGVEPAFLHTLLGEEAQPSGERSSRGLGVAGARCLPTGTGEPGGGWTGGVGRGDGWVPFGGPGAKVSTFGSEGGSDPAHLFGPLHMGMEPLLMPHRRPPPPPV